MPAVNHTRDGGNKIVLAAKALVILVQTFAAVLIQKYGANSPIGLLIEAILALSQLLPAAEAEVFEYGGQNTVPATEPENIVGINPDAPAPPAPPE